MLKKRRVIPVTRWQNDMTRFHPNFEGEHPGGGSGASRLFPPSTNLTRGLATHWIFRVLPCHEGMTYMPSPGFKPRPYGTAVIVTNHYSGWAARTNVLFKDESRFTLNNNSGNLLIWREQRTRF
ncbi:hypothetical protein TNCV_3982891 [Trichonephila clavipes]|nr:hypothetical protein TNCV_3982891 [Trichonephila clavipes]